MKTTIYCRISSLNQTQGVSLEAQLEECKQAIQFNKHTVDSVVQEVCSAYESTPPLLETLTRKRNHRVVFHAVDRFSRNVLNGVKNAKQMLKYHCELVFVRDRLVVRETQGPEWLRLVSLITQAEAESKNISLRVRNAISFLKRNGYQHSSHVPYGFSSLPDPVKPHLKRLHPNTVENAITKFIVLCRTKGASIGDINKALREFAPSAYKNPIVIEWNDTRGKVLLSSLRYELSYDDIAYFLNEYGMVYRGSEWNSKNVASIYRSFKKRSEDDVDELVSNFNFNLREERDETGEGDKKEGEDTEDTEDSEEVKIDANGWQVFPPGFSECPLTPPRTNYGYRVPTAPRKERSFAKKTEKTERSDRQEKR